ncbi:probable plastid-lipid-associated protein 4, chloroplastic isoform X2 [Citrus clementina]|uniref:probable plastid-lipid-associated protein 4, chloroplastic isoform X2 n=1 Tax=Citrus clementina TaxID=85681 RepID=UPI000CED2C56|nr:probable plastid-lipid-associated protein 4, chloroplastic isoform X2 [Citrus x clementina]
MALSSSSSTLCLHSATVVTGSQFSTPQLLFPSRVSFSYFPTKLNNNYQNNRNLSSTEYYHSSASQKWRASVSFFPAFLNKGKDAKVLKEELLEAIAPLDRGAEATPEDQQRVEQIARKLEGVNPTKEPLKSDLLNGKWELIYTTSQSILQTQVTADLTPLNSRKVAVQFDYFKIGGLIPVKAPNTARGELETTYLDEDLRISRGDKGNLFILKMVDPSYTVPT